MADYIIATDATLDLYKSTIHELDVHVIPMHYTMDGVEKECDPENVDFDYTAFYNALDAGSVVTTSQITPNMYISHFEELLKISNRILYICFTSGLSGTYGASKIAIEEIKETHPDADIRSIDSLCASIGEGLLVYLAAKKRLEGMSFDDLTAYVEENRRNVCHWFLVGNLEQLKRGGRINALEATLGSILNIHPILSVDEEGKLCVVTKVRGMKKAIMTLFEKVKQKGIDMSEQTILIGYAREKQNAELLAELIEQEHIVKEIKFMEIGPVIGSHTGAPMCAVVFLGNNDCK